MRTVTGNTDEKADFRQARKTTLFYIRRNKKWLRKLKRLCLHTAADLTHQSSLPWLQRNYNNCEVIAVSGDVGQGTELDGLEEKAIATGASKLYVLDLKKDYVENYIWPCL